MITLLDLYAKNPDASFRLNGNTWNIKNRGCHGVVCVCTVASNQTNGIPGKGEIVVIENDTPVEPV